MLFNILGSVTSESTIWMQSFPGPCATTALEELLEAVYPLLKLLFALGYRADGGGGDSSDVCNLGNAPQVFPHSYSPLAWTGPSW